MKLWLKISQGLAALLLSAAALSLLLFAGALILGLAAAALIAAAGLFLAAPDEAKTGLKNVAAALEKLADRFAKSVNDMGQVVLACFGAQQAAPNTPHESSSGENMSSPDNTCNSTRTATDDPSGPHAAQCQHLFQHRFCRHSYFWPPYPICFFRIFHFVVRKLKRDTHFISFACTEI